VTDYEEGTLADYPEEILKFFYCGAPKVYAKSSFFLSLQICEPHAPQGHLNPLLQMAQV